MKNPAVIPDSSKAFFILSAIFAFMAFTSERMGDDWPEWTWRPKETTNGVTSPTGPNYQLGQAGYVRIQAQEQALEMCSAHDLVIFIWTLICF